MTRINRKISKRKWILIILVAITSAILIWLGVRAYQHDNPFQLQQTYSYGDTFQEFAPVHPLEKDQKQLFVELPKGDDAVVWTVVNSGCLAFKATDSLFSPRPISELSLGNGASLHSGARIFISCEKVGSELSFNRHLPRPTLATPTAKP